jgi:cell division transport system permease protein
MVQLNLCLEGLRRAWRYHFGLQLTTLFVISGTFTVVAFALSVGRNLDSILRHWGDSVELTVFLKDDLTEQDRAVAEKSIRDLKSIRDIKFVSKEQARTAFAARMANYAPTLLEDDEFTEAFPASFELKLNQDIQTLDYKATIAGIGQIAGVEEVSYGQGWIENYSAFVRVFSRVSWAIGFLLLFAALLMTGNSIRESVSQRSEEIAIMELIGASRQMIRTPFLFEGLFMGTVSATIAVVVTDIVLVKQIHLLLETPSLAGIATHIKVLGGLESLCFILAGGAAGLLGALFTLSYINDGWALSRRQARST